jgi:hypothetical protein
MSTASGRALNEDFDFASDATPEVSRAFEGDVTVKLRLPASTRLWKWADFAPEPGSAVSPWWLPFDPNELAIGDQFWTFSKVETQAKSRGGGPRSIFRSGVAVLPEWSRLTHMVVTALQQDAVAFAGPAAMQQVTDIDGVPMPIYLTGGLWQLYVPRLSMESVHICDPRSQLRQVGADVDFWLSSFPADTRTVPLNQKTRRLLKLFGLSDDGNPPG